MLRQVRADKTPHKPLIPTTWCSQQALSWSSSYLPRAQGGQACWLRARLATARMLHAGAAPSTTAGMRASMGDACGPRSSRAAVRAAADPVRDVPTCRVRLGRWHGCADRGAG